MINTIKQDCRLRRQSSIPNLEGEGKLYFGVPDLFRASQNTTCSFQMKRKSSLIGLQIESLTKSSPDSPGYIFHHKKIPLPYSCF